MQKETKANKCACFFNFGHMVVGLIVCRCNDNITESTASHKKLLMRTAKKRTEVSMRSEHTVERRFQRCFRVSWEKFHISLNVNRNYKFFKFKGSNLRMSSERNLSKYNREFKIPTEYSNTLESAIVSIVLWQKITCRSVLNQYEF